MPLQKEQQIKAETLQSLLTIEEKLGEGGQGEVYRVTDGKNVYALKWYNLEQSTEEQKAAIRYLVNQGAPHEGGQRFIWPLDLIILNHTQQFGYLMPLIDTQRFADLGEVQAHLKPAPSLSTLCEISYQIANSYRALHLSGYCYRDIAAGNIMFDTQTGEVLICDNDNVGINRQSPSQVWGTMEYMAPEVVRGEAVPSTDTDLYSLAVLLFNLWVWHHPLHGEMEYQIKCWDVPAKHRIYGETPIFIFDPTDKRNQLPLDSEYHIARQRWDYCPPGLQSLFIRAFTEGTHNPLKRITEGEWQTFFLQLKDGALSCPNCQAENLWELGQSLLHCWHCEKAIPIPPKLKLTHQNNQQTILLTLKTQLRQRHLQPTTDTPNTLIGQVVQNPNNPDIWGLRNLTDMAWTATFPDGTFKTIEPQRAVPLKLGLKLTLGDGEAEIIE
jgi:eukaryotic-like serine/threonine-protein kinase